MRLQASPNFLPAKKAYARSKTAVNSLAFFLSYEEDARFGGNDAHCRAS
jgi:hypothetical protein